MSAEELKVLLEHFDLQRQKEVEALNVRWDYSLRAAKEEVCLAHGNHEFEEVGNCGYKTKKCKYCGKEK